MLNDLLRLICHKTSTTNEPLLTITALFRLSQLLLEQHHKNNALSETFTTQSKQPNHEWTTLLRQLTTSLTEQWQLVTQTTLLNLQTDCLMTPVHKQINLLILMRLDQLTHNLTFYTFLVFIAKIKVGFKLSHLLLSSLPLLCHFTQS